MENRDADGLLTMPEPSEFRPFPGPELSDPERPALDPELVPASAEPVGILGVASYNVYRPQPVEAVAAEARRLIALPDVALIGWQEALRHRAAFVPLLDEGWETAYFAGAGEAPISWDARVFEYVDASQHRMHAGYQGRTMKRPPRWVTRVTLRHRDTGHRLTALNTHVASRGESWERLGTWNDNETATKVREHLAGQAQMWQNVPGRYVLGTGDMNIDARADAATVLPGGPVDRFRLRAVSNWEALGTDGISRTLDMPAGPDKGSPLLYDYVYAAARSVQTGWLRFVSQEALAGFGSDHTPLVVRLELR